MQQPSSERDEIRELLDASIETADRTPGRAKREQHSKHHGCVTATFTVGEWVPDDLRVGIFSTSTSYPAFVRFSNGRVWDDRKADAHGMAIKLLGVDGAKLVPAHQSETAADFVLVDSEVFFTGDLHQYRLFAAGFEKAQANPLYAPGFWLRAILFQGALLKRVRAFTSGRPASPLAIPYYSAVPYGLGTQAVKYVVRPQDRDLATASTLADANGLSRALVEALATREVVFDFGVDVQTDPARQPIEDPTIKWSALPSARREWLGTVTIPAQTVDPHSSLAEDLAFSPWHTTEDHCPLGAINRARRPVYEELAILRHQANGVSPAGGSEIPSRAPGNHTTET
jgi:hypothetical protein